ncbi:unnamed protein product [Amoebophrya sp. A120]|nr:unnamed protein product [Amoebophrya sp. A120]|eukprot:GSA120T00009443001.1
MAASSTTTGGVHWRGNPLTPPNPNGRSGSGPRPVKGVDANGVGLVNRGRPADIDKTMGKVNQQLLKIIGVSPHYVTLMGNCLAKKTTFTVKGKKFATSVVRQFYENYDENLHTLGGKPNPYLVHPTERPLAEKNRELARKAGTWKMPSDQQVPACWHTSTAGTSVSGNKLVPGSGTMQAGGSSSSTSKPNFHGDGPVFNMDPDDPRSPLYQDTGSSTLGGSTTSMLGGNVKMPPGAGVDQNSRSRPISARGGGGRESTGQIGEGRGMNSRKGGDQGDSSGSADNVNNNSYTNGMMGVRSNLNAAKMTNNNPAFSMSGNKKKLLKRQKSGPLGGDASGDSSEPELVEPDKKRAKTDTGVPRLPSRGNSRNQSPLAGNKKAARGNAFPHARAGTVGNSKDNRGQNSAMKNKKKGEIPGANLTQVSDLKQFFKEHNIPINHLLEKSDYFAMKMQFDELYKEFGSTGIAAKKLRESLIEVQARGGAGANNAGGTAQKQMNPNIPAGVPSASSAAFRSNLFEPENARQERLAAIRSASSIGGTKGPVFMSTSKPVFQPNIRAGSGGPGSSSSSSSSSNLVSTGPVSAKELDIVQTAKKIVQTREYGKWAYDVLQLSWRTAEMKDIQKQYKIFMMKLHPDKHVGLSGNNAELLSQALEKIKRAKSVAEDELSRMKHDPPEMIRGIKATCLNDTRGQRIFKISWDQPRNRDENAPIEKFHVQVHDPKYGKFLTLSVIEGDYDEAAKRVLKIEELNYFKMEEKNMGKLSHIFNEQEISVQVCAQNKIGMGTYGKCTFRSNLKASNNRPAVEKFATLPPPQQIDYNARLRGQNRGQKEQSSATKKKTGGSSPSKSNLFGYMSAGAANVYKPQPASVNSGTTSFKTISGSGSGTSSHVGLLNQLRGQVQYPPGPGGANTSRPGEQPQQLSQHAVKAKMRVEQFGNECDEIFKRTRQLPEDKRQEDRLKWIRTQPVPVLQNFLKANAWPHKNPADDIGRRVLTFMELKMRNAQ